MDPGVVVSAVPERLQMDILSAVVRIEQAHEEPGMAEFLLYRLATCDAVRLRRHLTAETLAWEAEMRTVDPEPLRRHAEERS